jgi:hypothetical protein
MDRKVKLKLVAGAVAGLAAVGGGAAFAATQLGSPKEESQAIINDAASQLGIQPSKLSDALKKAYEKRVDAAVAAGTLTKQQGDDLKAKIASGDFPLVFAPGTRGFHEGHHGFGADLGVASKYLGVTDAELRTELESGKTLATIAKDKGKSVDGLIGALVDSAKTRLDEAVKSGKLTKEQETEMLNGLKDRITDLVNGRFPAPPHGDRAFGDRFGDRFRGDRFRGDRFRGGPPNFLLPTA